MLGKLTGEHETHSGLHLSGCHRVPLVVLAQTASFGGDSLESVVDKRVEDGHRSLGDAGVGVDLLQHAVDVDVV